MGVENANPEFAVDAVEFADQARQRRGVCRQFAGRCIEPLRRRNIRSMAGPQIEPVIGRVLRNQIQLLHAVGDELPCFLHDVCLATAAVRAAHARDDAKTARMIAALCNLHIREVIRCQSKPGRLKCRDVIGPRVNIDQRLARQTGGKFGDLPLGLVDAWFFLRLAKPRSAIADCLPHDVADLLDLVDTHERIHLRHQIGQLLPITL